MCIAFSIVNNANYVKMSAEEVQRRPAYGRTYLEFCAKLYAIQWRAGRYLLHEHPEGASSWQERCITKMLNKHGVMRTNGDQCMCGLRSHDGVREGPARKGIGFITNSICIAKKSSRRCPNRRGEMLHKHVVLKARRIRAAQVYPEGLCKAICERLQEQKRLDEKGQFLLMNVNSDTKASSKELHVCAEDIKKKYATVEEKNDEELEDAWGDVSGAALDPKMVRKARQEEMTYVNQMNFYDKV